MTTKASSHVINGPSVAAQVAALLTFGRDRNLIDNPNCNINQRQVTSATTVAGVIGGDTYVADRWISTVAANASASYTLSSPAVSSVSGATTSLRHLCGTGFAVGATDYSVFVQRIEALFSAQFLFGTAAAKTITLSFDVYSSKTGTLGGSVRNHDGTRSYPFTVTINSANTWERKSVTIPGDTSGTWPSAVTTSGFQVTFSPMSGSTYLGTANAWAGANYLGATGQTQWSSTNDSVYITAIQLEAGSVATPYVHPNLALETLRCQRYYYKNYAGNIILRPWDGQTTGIQYHWFPWPIAMRGTPVVGLNGAGSSNTSGLASVNANAQGVEIYYNILGTNAYAVVSMTATADL